MCDLIKKECICEFNVYCPESPCRDECAPMVDINSDCRHSCGVYYHEKLPMQVNSLYSFSSGPKKPWCSVLLLTIHRALTFICSNCA